MPTSSLAAPPDHALVGAPLRATDLATCAAILRDGSKSFATAAWLLPPRLRGPAAAVYAFCRVADDLIDQGGEVERALAALHQRLAAIYAGAPQDDPVDRAFAWAVATYRIPRAVPAALLEGFAWDQAGRRYATLDELLGYCARVASTVGVMMTLLMGERRAPVLARACELGLAMQLTNICRDVGEDARYGRLYLPLDWLAEAGLAPATFVADPRPSRALATLVERLLAVADGFYRRADAGISHLPRDCRLGIRAARLIYADIGRVIRAADYDVVGRRAFTSAARKLWLLVRSLPVVLWPARPVDAPAEPSVAFLVDAVGR